MNRRDEHADTAMEAAIGRLLQVGVTLSALTILAGGLLYLHQAHGPMQNYHAFRLMSENLRNPAGIIRGALAGDSRSIIQLGLLLLIATPIARVAFAAGAFWAEKDRLYTAVSVTVLAILLASMLFGH